MAPGGAPRMRWLTVGRRDPTAPAAATKDLQADSVRGPVPIRSGPTQAPAVTSPATGTGPVCRQVGPTAAARPGPTGPDAA